MDYQLKIKQLVDYPRCRIYREFVQKLIQDKSIRTNGSSYLFYYIILCSFSNYRSSYKRIDGISYLVSPGEWICKPAELTEWFRTRFHHQSISVLKHLSEMGLITYSKLGAKGNLIKYKINNWKNFNTSLDYNYPCLKDVGFFFFPIAAVHELISPGKCSEMDILLDLWIHAIYNDEQVQGSDIGPVVYFRNQTGSPITSYSDLSGRWNLSKATVSRTLSKLQDLEYISLISFTGRHGSAIYLTNYLSTMFNISDVMIDKEEVSMSFKLPIHIPGECSLEDQTTIKEEQIIVSDSSESVSKSHIVHAVRKVAQILISQGISCCECPKTIYKLYRLSDCKDTSIKYLLHIGCPDRDLDYRFELTLTPCPEKPEQQTAKGGHVHEK